MSNVLVVITCRLQLIGNQPDNVYDGEQRLGTESIVLWSKVPIVVNW